MDADGMKESDQGRPCSATNRRIPDILSWTDFAMLDTRTTIRSRSFSFRFMRISANGRESISKISLPVRANKKIFAQNNTS